MKTETKKETEKGRRKSKILRESNEKRQGGSKKEIRKGINERNEEKVEAKKTERHKEI